MSTSTEPIVFANRLSGSPQQIVELMLPEERSALEEKVSRECVADPKVDEHLAAARIPQTLSGPEFEAGCKSYTAAITYLCGKGFSRQEVTGAIAIRCVHRNGTTAPTSPASVPAQEEPAATSGSQPEPNKIQALPPKRSAIEELTEILNDCNITGKAKPLHDAKKVFGRVTDDADWIAFLAECKQANKESKNGLRIETALLNRRRNERIAANRNAADTMRAPVIEMPISGIVEPVPPRLDLGSLHDSGNAARFVLYYGQNIRWCGAMKKWLIWDGRRWSPDDMERPRKMAVNCMVEFLRQAVNQNDMAAQRFAVASLDFKRIRDMLEIAKALVPLNAADLDTDPMLLNCTNGTVHLGSGEKRPHRREDYITRLVHHDYMPDAQCPLFLALLTRAMGGGEQASDEEKKSASEMVAWLRKVFGYGLTGLTVEKLLFILHGATNCGKTTLLSAIYRVIEEYGTLLQIDTLMSKDQGNNQQADLADLRGARFVMTSETEENQKLAEARVKRLVQGVQGAKLKCAKKYENHITFPETWKLFIDANHLPVVRGSDSAIWNRLCPIPFRTSIPEGEIDKTLPEKLHAEAPGILSWLVAGAVAWRAAGLGRPDQIRAARSEWRKDSEVLKDFFDECCYRKVGAHILVSDLWDEYQTWARKRKEREKAFEPVTRDQFTQRLEDIGFKRVMWRFDKGYPERTWEGIALL